MKPQPLLYLRPLESFERPLRDDPPMIADRLANWTWAIVLLSCLAVWGVVIGVWCWG